MNWLDIDFHELEPLMKQMGMESSQIKQLQNMNTKKITDHKTAIHMNEIREMNIGVNFNEEFEGLMVNHPFSEYLIYLYVHLIIINKEATHAIIQHFNTNIRLYMDYYLNDFEDKIYLEGFNPEQLTQLKILECVVSYALVKDKKIESILYELIKKSNRSIYNQVRNVKETKYRTFDYSHHLRKKLEKIKESEYLPFMLKSSNELLAAYLFCLRNELIIIIDGDHPATILEIAYDKLIEYEVDLEEEQEAFKQIYIYPNREKYDLFKKNYHIDNKKPIIVRDLLLKMLTHDKEAINQEYLDLFLNLLQRSIHFDINTNELFHHSMITTDQVDLIVHQYYEMVDNNVLDISFSVYFVIQLVIITILNEHKKIKNAFTGYVEDSFEQLAQVYEEEKNNDYVKLLDHKENELYSLQSENEKLKLRIKQMEAQLTESDMQHKRLEKELERVQPQEELLREVHALREYMYSHNNEAGSSVEVTSYEQVIHALSNKDILLVGGHTNMTNKLKEVLPSIEIFNIDQLGKTQNFSKYDHVFIYWSFCNHAAYNKTITQISQAKGKLHYLSGSTNIELVTREMYRSITE